MTGTHDPYTPDLDIRAVRTVVILYG